MVVFLWLYTLYPVEFAQIINAINVIKAMDQTAIECDYKLYKRRENPVVLVVFQQNRLTYVVLSNTSDKLVKSF